MFDGSTYFAAYRIGGRNIYIYNTLGSQRFTFTAPQGIVSPAALGPYIFVFNMEDGAFCIDARTGSYRTL